MSYYFFDLPGHRITVYKKSVACKFYFDYGPLTRDFRLRMLVTPSYFPLVGSLFCGFRIYTNARLRTNFDNFAWSFIKSLCKFVQYKKTTFDWIVENAENSDLTCSSPLISTWFKIPLIPTWVKLLIAAPFVIDQWRNASKKEIKAFSWSEAVDSLCSAIVWNQWNGRAIGADFTGSGQYRS